MSASFVMWLPIALTGAVSRTGKLAFHICRAWVWLGKTICFATVQYEISPQIDRSRSYIIASNHQSLLDIPALMLMGFQFRWVLKKELGYIPLFGWALYLARHIFINRSSPKLALKNMAMAMKKLPPGVSVAIFPEGTRADDGVLREFKIGGFLTAIESGLPILPVTINGSWKRLPDKSSLSFVPGPIQVIAHPPVEVAGRSKKDIGALMEEVRSVIASRLDSNWPSPPAQG